MASLSASVESELPLVDCAPAIAIHPNKLTVSVKALNIFIAASLHTSPMLHCGKVLPGSSMDPGTACIFLDNGNIPLYTGTCQHVESATPGKVAIAARSE
jgi:hypothetical protein